MTQITVYGTHVCPACFMAKKLLDAKNYKYASVTVEPGDAVFQDSGMRSVPIIQIDQKYYNLDQLKGFLK